MRLEGVVKDARPGLGDATDPLARGGMHEVLARLSEPKA
jgi:hypothetical protein